MLQYIDVPSVVLIFLAVIVCAGGIAYANAKSADVDHRHKPE